MTTNVTPFTTRLQVGHFSEATIVGRAGAAFLLELGSCQNAVLPIGNLLGASQADRMHRAPEVARRKHLTVQVVSVDDRGLGKVSICVKEVVAGAATAHQPTSARPQERRYA